MFFVFAVSAYYINRMLCVTTASRRGNAIATAGIAEYFRLAVQLPLSGPPTALLAPSVAIHIAEWPAYRFTCIT